MMRIRLVTFCPWAGELEDADAFLERLPRLDLRARVSDPADGRLLRMARLDCDWFGECVRCFSGVAREGFHFLPARVAGAKGMAGLAEAAMRRPSGEQWWLVFAGQHPQHLANAGGALLAFLRKTGVRVLFYAFDEASRTMPCFRAVAPHLDVLIHDESPLDPAGAALLRSSCLTLHRSWVANIVPFAAPFNEAPEERILFLGSQLGLTPHRRRQIDFLRREFRDRFVASHDHSVAVGDRYSLNKYKAGLAPEGRKFTTPAMAKTHTDRPFWCGCLGLVPVSEDSRAGGRLDGLAEAGLIVRYPHGDLRALREACERALAAGNDERRRIYEHFNRHEVVGETVAEAIAGVASRDGLSQRSP